MKFFKFPWPFLLLLALSLPAGAEVRVNLAQGTITQHQPFQVSFEAQGPSVDRPDLSPLQQDFDIAGSRFSSSTRSFNGRTTRSQSVTVTLVPRRSGDLAIPAIEFGQERSRPVPIKVAAGSPGDTGAPYSGPQGQPAAPAMPFRPPQQGYSQSYSYSTGPSGTSPGWNGMPGWGGSQGLPGWMGGISGMEGWSTPQPAAETEPEPDGKQEAQPNYWPWITALAILGWLVTSVALWRVRSGQQRPERPRRRPRPAAIPPAERQQEPARPGDLLAEVRKAYQGNQPFAAKEALLRWAGRIWPDDPPSNLSRLAVRCPPQLQRHILKLDEALYSPSPVSWSEDAVWDELESITRREQERTPEPEGLTPLNP